jgi:hypothetical protein
MYCRFLVGKRYNDIYSQRWLCFEHMHDLLGMSPWRYSDLQDTEDTEKYLRLDSNLQGRRYHTRFEHMVINLAVRCSRGGTQTPPEMDTLTKCWISEGAEVGPEGRAADQRSERSFEETLRLLDKATAEHSKSSGTGAGEGEGEGVASQEAATARRLLETILSATHLGAGSGSQDGADTFVQTMMTTLLCKEVLYEPMKVCHEI